MNVLKEKYILHYLGTPLTMYQPTIWDLEMFAIDEAKRIVDLSNAYRIETWYEPHTDRLIFQFLLAD